MNNKVWIWCIFVVAGVLLAVVWIWHNSMPDPVLAVLSPLVAVLIVIFTYLFNQANRRSDIAKAIVQEIRSAENTIREVKKSGFINNEISILPSNSWQINRHLFASELTGDEMDQLGRFYSGCEFLDETARMLIRGILDSNEAFIRRMIEKSDSVIDDTLKDKIKKQSESYKQLVEHGAISNHFFTSLNRMEIIGDSRVTDKLRGIAGSK